MELYYKVFLFAMIFHMILMLKTTAFIIDITQGGCLPYIYDDSISEWQMSEDEWFNGFTREITFCRVQLQQLVTRP
jgi:hypothetical protein